jgi:hypothetical protein
MSYFQWGCRIQHRLPGLPSVPEHLPCQQCHRARLYSREDREAHTQTPQLNGNDKRRKHLPGDRPFRPTVFSLGGITEKEPRDALKSWKTGLAGGLYSLRVRRLSLSLLRERPAALSHERRSEYIIVS